MSDDKKNQRDEPWRKQVPDYMVAAIDSICDARDDIRAMQAELSKRTQELHQEEQRLSDREQIVGDREGSLLSAIEDMKKFANRLYGPDSELTQINSKLASAEMAATNRDARYAQQYREVSDNQTRFKDAVETRFGLVEQNHKHLELRVADLEKRKTG